MSKLQKSNIYCIYKHTSPIEKHYIGQTNNYSKRTSNHKKRNNQCLAFANAIKKYGWENFTHEILEENLTIDQANEREQFYIEYYNSLAPNGYNLQTGGNNFKSCKESIEKGKKTRSSDEYKNELSKRILKYHSIPENKENFLSKIPRKEWILINNNGEEIIVKNLPKFCDENNIKYNTMATVLGYGGEHKGYRLKGIKHKQKIGESQKKEWTIITPDKNIIKIDDLKQFCIDNNLNDKNLRSAIYKRSTYKGYSGLIVDEKQKPGECFRKEWNIVFPNGKKELVTNLKEFCFKHNLCYEPMIGLRKGGIYKGYYLDNIVRKNKQWYGCRAKNWKLIDDNGNVLNINNLKKFCEENNLNYKCMFSVLKKGKKYKGYVLVVEPDPTPVEPEPTV